MNDGAEPCKLPLSHFATLQFQTSMYYNKILCDRPTQVSHSCEMGGKQSMVLQYFSFCIVFFQNKYLKCMKNNLWIVETYLPAKDASLLWYFCQFWLKFFPKFIFENPLLAVRLDEVFMNIIFQVFNCFNLIYSVSLALYIEQLFSCKMNLHSESRQKM